MRCAVHIRHLGLLWGPMAPQTPPKARRVASIFLPPRLPKHLPKLQSWLSPISGLVPPGTRPTPPPLHSCRCCVCSPPSPWYTLEYPISL